MNLATWVVFVARFLQVWGAIAVVGALASLVLEDAEPEVGFSVLGIVVGSVAVLAGTAVLRRALVPAGIAYAAWVILGTVACMVALHDPREPMRALVFVYVPIVFGLLGYGMLRAISAANRAAEEGRGSSGS